MSASQKTAGIFAVVLLLLGLAGLMKTPFAAALYLNDGRTAVSLATACWAAVACFSGKRISNVFLVSVGLLFCIDAFIGMTRDTFYLSFEALNGPVDRPPLSERFMAALPHLILGPAALIAGIFLTNRGAKGGPLS